MTVEQVFRLCIHTLTPKRSPPVPSLSISTKHPCQCKVGRLAVFDPPSHVARKGAPLLSRRARKQEFTPRYP